jgi:phage gp45-like
MAGTVPTAAWRILCLILWLKESFKEVEHGGRFRWNGNTSSYLSGHDWECAAVGGKREAIVVLASRKLAHDLPHATKSRTSQYIMAK